MRAKVWETDRWWEAQVFFNGVEQRGVCLEADEENGFIIRRVKDENGKLVRDGDAFIQEKVYGAVRITLP